MNKYFISYKYKDTNGNVADANNTVALRYKLDSEVNVRKLEESLRNKDNDNFHTVINNFILL